MNFAIVGCGFIAKKHAKAIQEVENANLVAVSDKLNTAMEPYVEEYGVAAYEELDQMLLREDIDVVSVCTPTGLHAPLAIKVANAKKHVILEKPIAMTLEETDKIIEACNRNEVKLSIVHPNRFRPVVMELRKILDQKLLGKISHANAIVNWNRNQEYYDQALWRGTKEFDGGALMNQAIHNLDLLLWFMGKPEQIFSMEATRLRKIEAEDVSTGVIKFKSGALGLVEASTTAYGQNFEESITLFGEKGTVKIGGKNAIYFEHLEIEGMDEDEINEIKEKIKVDPFGIPGHQCIIDDMVKAIEEDRQPAVSGEEGRKSLELVLSFYESAKNNQPIQLTKEKEYVNN
ncbi:Gfo/Idh/MocA family protein [Oceanobacillus profundus]|uniref:Gfo/Idh/MocA family oxidoreductase n=1 Tax=Oceanobacillus profundus TaxID=372463 RepID=A0A417YCP2_9BACI|nr:Gfo/Idh/MocA family oxidoreductase [Oceanobacillus profundus]RHW30390.1 gfo/Idh/MocA family oxidoreductase [Oceanobacillus profundus]